MSTTPNCGITYIDATLSLIAQINDALRVIDALLQCAVLGFEDDPPADPEDGDQYIVGTGTGAWVGRDDYLAQWVDQGAFWQFYAPGTQVREVKLGAAKYLYDAGVWVGLAPAVAAEDVTYDNATSGLTASDVQAAIDELAATPPAPDAEDVPYDNATSGLTATDVQAAIDELAATGPGSTSVAIVTEASTSTMDPATHAGTNRYIRCSGDVTFDNAEGYTAGEVYNIRAVAALDLIETSVTLTPPAGGTLALDAGASVTVIMTASNTGDVIGQTVPA